MEGINGCNLLNTKRNRQIPSEYMSQYHVHIIVRFGTMRFSDGKREVRITERRFGDLADVQFHSACRIIGEFRGRLPVTIQSRDGLGFKGVYLYTYQSVVPFARAVATAHEQ